MSTFDTISFFIICFSFGVVFSSNPMVSLFFMLLVFAFGSFLFFNLGASFLAIIYVVVYMGAVAVLFLFIVMMLNVQLIPLSVQSVRNFFFSIPLVFVFLFSILQLVDFPASVFVLDLQVSNYTIWFNEVNSVSNISGLGQLIYTTFFFDFILAGLVLFAAMVGAIYLTLASSGFFFSNQQIYKQLEKNGQVLSFRPK